MSGTHDKIVDTMRALIDCPIKLKASSPVQVKRELLVLCPRSPKAEATVLETVRCRFESCRGYLVRQNGSLP